MADVEQHIDEIDGEPVSWRSAAYEGTATLYVHGVPNSSLTWQPFLERTGGLALDLPGFGDSVKAVTFPYSIAGYDGYLERFLDWIGLESVNLVSLQTGMDNIRNVIGCAAAGLTRHEAFDASPIAAEFTETFLRNKAFTNLPRKFNVGITGCTEHCTHGESQDLALTPAMRCPGSPCQGPDAV